MDTVAAEEVVPNVVVEPRSYTNQEGNDMTPDQAHAATARGLLTVPQMQRLLGGPPLSTKALLRRLLTAAPIGASAATAAAEAKAVAETKAAEEAKTAAPEATAAAEAKAAAESKAAEGGNGFPGMTGLGSGSAAAIESMLRGRLQDPGHSGASGIANLAASLPTARGISFVLTFLQDPE